LFVPLSVIEKRGKLIMCQRFLGMKQKNNDGVQPQVEGEIGGNKKEANVVHEEYNVIASLRCS
jgi:hypothetical protein